MSFSKWPISLFVDSVFPKFVSFRKSVREIKLSLAIGKTRDCTILISLCQDSEFHTLKRTKGQNDRGGLAIVGEPAVAETSDFLP